MFAAGSDGEKKKKKFGFHKPAALSICDSHERLQCNK